MTAESNTTDDSIFDGTFDEVSWNVKSTLRRYKFCTAPVRQCANDQCRDKHGICRKTANNQFQGHCGNNRTGNFNAYMLGYHM